MTTSVGARHLGWSFPNPRIHAVTVTSLEAKSITARADCGRPVTAVLERTVVARHPNLCARCRQLAPETGVGTVIRAVLDGAS